jgi:excisionase family DNA binding protein
MNSAVARAFVTSQPVAPGALSVDRAAEYLSISRAGLYRIFKSGALKPARIGGRTVVRRLDLDEFLARSVGADASSRGG